MRYRYDNSAANVRNPQQPPQRVTWGQRSADEMGDLWIQVLTRDARDLDRLTTALRPKILAEDIIGYEARIRAEPDSAPLHDDVALLYLEQGKPGEAVAHLRRSLALRPSAAAQFNLGTALAHAGEDDAAIASYEAALRERPDYAVAHNNLGALLLNRGKVAEAAPHLEAAVRLAPQDADAQQNLGVLLSAMGDGAGAREHFIAASALRPDWPDPVIAAAWIMATGPAAVRDLPRATGLAERAVRQTGGRDARALNALGVAYGEAGDLTRAIAALQQAAPLASGPLAADITTRLAAYRSRAAAPR
jgi:tetratricopeptide (TPR) repeat protein